MNTIDKLQNDLEQWYESSSISQFMHWWKTELKSFVPKKYQDLLFPQPVRILLTQDNHEVSVWSNQGDDFEEQGSVTTEDGEPEQWWHKVQHIINGADGRRILVEYLLPNDDALVRKIALPAAAKENLDEVIGFELDKYVPFNLEQVQFSYKIDKANTSKDKILIDMAVIPKQKVADILNLCDEKSVSIDGIDINLVKINQKPMTLGVNLLPTEKRKSRSYFNLKLNSALVAVLFSLIYFVMHTSLTNKESKIDRLTEINTQLQKQARSAKLLRKELKAVIVSSRFLQNKKKNHPALVTIFSDITTRLPDHTYIIRLKIDHDSFELTGNSNNANSLVPLLDQSKNWFQPQTIGGVRKDPRTNKEKFTIKAVLQEPQAEVEDGSNS